MLARPLLPALLLASMLAAGACGPAPEQAAKLQAKPAPPPPPLAPKLDPPVSADDLPPRKQVEAEGITVAELADGRVRVTTTALWKEALESTYDSCDYYRAAVPVLARQVTKERARSLYEVCGMTAPAPERPAKGGTTKRPSVAAPKPVASP